MHSNGEDIFKNGVSQSRVMVNPTCSTKMEPLPIGVQNIMFHETPKPKWLHLLGVNLFSGHHVLFMKQPSAPFLGLYQLVLMFNLVLLFLVLVILCLCLILMHLFMVLIVLLLLFNLTFFPLVFIVLLFMFNLVFFFQSSSSCCLCLFLVLLFLVLIVTLLCLALTIPLLVFCPNVHFSNLPCLVARP